MYSVSKVILNSTLLRSNLAKICTSIPMWNTLKGKMFSTSIPAWTTLKGNMFSSLTMPHIYKNERTLQNPYTSGLLQVASKRGKSTKYPKNAFPPLDETELDEQIVLGTGPGGQSVNRTMNAVLLKHSPTGLAVKCHEHRSLAENQKEARLLLQIKLDVHFNGEDGIVMKTKREQVLKNQTRKLRNQARQALKKSFKEDQDLKS